MPTENNFQKQFSMRELNNGINTMNNGKAAGFDDICMEQIKNFAPEARDCILELFNIYGGKSFQISEMWRKSILVALLKHGKESEFPKSYRPKRRLILNRVEKTIDTNRIPRQASFRPGKSCTSQILALTRHIEEGFENIQIPGRALVHLCPAYDIVRHQI